MTEGNSSGHSGVSVDEMEADRPIAVGERTESGAEGDDGAVNKTTLPCEDEECLQSGAEVESEVSSMSLGGMEAAASAAGGSMEEAGEKAVSVGKAEDAILEGSFETPERLASTAGRGAASVAMREGFRSCSEFDIVGGWR